MENCLFCKIIKKELRSNIVHEDDQVLAFDDINPQAPVHSLVIPKRHIVSLNEVGEEESSLLGHLFLVARRVAEQKGVDVGGYRTVVNTNIQAGQTVFHLHLHVLGGRTLSWPPG